MRTAYLSIIVLMIFGCKTNNSENKDAAYVSTSPEINISEENKQQVQQKNPEQEEKSPVVQFQETESFKRGKNIYTDFCIACHLPTGKGIAGTFPPLDGSDWLTKRRTDAIHAIKYGLSGPVKVNGEEYNSVMVPMGLTDEEVADVMNYISNSWSNSEKNPVTPEEVAAVKE